MLKLKSIKKDYVMSEMPTVHALRGITINFRRNEFVAILGQSGCGKTTLLNIIGGLDRYTSGDLIIEGKSTKKYTDRDWDTYRNHSIGFVFQSYNLIGHINVLANVELALTIAGVDKEERKRRALEVLKVVGLEGMEKKRPNQLSGGQMQRVAIARALVNNPEILLADEPTGALDSETSIQIMNLLKEVAKKRLVIMVTHNPDLANQYATRIVTARDGKIIGDSNPYSGEDRRTMPKTKDNKKGKKAKKEEVSKGKKKLSSMSFKTALGLSFNNMMTKKGRTFLTAFAGSIGIIGIALILSVSFGFDGYIGQVQEDALTSYPMTVTKTSINASSAMSSLIGSIGGGTASKTEDGKVGMDDTISNLVTKLVNSVNSNNIKGFKSYIENKDNRVLERYSKHLSGISYGYSADFTTYTKFEGKPIKKAYPADLTVTDRSCIEDLKQVYQNTMMQIFDTVGDSLSSYFTNSMFPTFSEMIPNIDPDTMGKQEYSDILTNQYDVVYGKLPKESNEVVIVLDSNNNINDFLLYSLGLRNPQNLVIQVAKGLAASAVPAEELAKIKPVAEDYFFPMSYEEICKCKYYLPLTYQLFYPDEANTSESETLRYYLKKDADIASYLQSSSTDPTSKNYVMNLDIVGIVRAKPGKTSTSLQGAIGYLPSLATDYLITKTSEIPSDEYYSKVENNVVQGQIKLKDKWDVLRGQPFKVDVTEDKADVSIKAYPAGEDVFKELGLPEIASSLLAKALKGYAIIGYTNLSDDSFSFENGTNSYYETYVTGISELVESLGYSLVTKDGGTSLNSIAGLIHHESGILLLTTFYDGEISSSGTPLTCSFSYTYQTQNSKARTYQQNCRTLGISDLSDPNSVYLYPKDFASKKYVDDLVNEFNTYIETDVRAHPEKYTTETEIDETMMKRLVQENQVTVTDTVGLLMGSVQTIVDSVSYVLIAFVSISLIVSSIMIAIITYVSVLERTKEIGILRSLGARKSDIANVFNAETLIIGLTAGLIGVIAALILDIPITIIITSLASISLTIVVPWYGIIILPVISILLTVISGLIPSIIASKKDPVIALRSGD